jgi:Arc/MetJ family transcription regulator
VTATGRKDHRGGHETVPLGDQAGSVSFALRSLASEPFSLEEARRMRGSGWDGDLDEMRGRGDDPR